MYPHYNYSRFLVAHGVFPAILLLQQAVRSQEKRSE